MPTVTLTLEKFVSPKNSDDSDTPIHDKLNNAWHEFIANDLESLNKEITLGFSHEKQLKAYAKMSIEEFKIMLANKNITDEKMQNFIIALVCQRDDSIENSGSLAFNLHNFVQGFVASLNPNFSLIFHTNAKFEYSTKADGSAVININAELSTTNPTNTTKLSSRTRLTATVVIDKNLQLSYENINLELDQSIAGNAFISTVLKEKKIEAIKTLTDLLTENCSNIEDPSDLQKAGMKLATEINKTDLSAVTKEDISHIHNLLDHAVAATNLATKDNPIDKKHITGFLESTQKLQQGKSSVTKKIVAAAFCFGAALCVIGAGICIAAAVVSIVTHGNVPAALGCLYGAFKFACLAKAAIGLAATTLGAGICAASGVGFFCSGREKGPKKAARQFGEELVKRTPK